MKLHAKTGIAMGALLALAVPTAQANTGVTSGFYAGASVGLSSLSGSQDFLATNSVNVPPIMDSRRFGVSANSLGVSIVGGYGYKWDSYWLAGEFSYLFDRLDSQQKATLNGSAKDLIWKSRSTGALGGALHLGYVPNCQSWVVYAIVGVELRRFQVSFQDQNTPVIIASQVNKKYNSLAFVPGLGIRINLTKNVAVRGEYKYAFHGSKRITGSTPNVLGVDTTTLKNSPRIQTFQIGVVYGF